MACTIRMGCAQPIGAGTCNRACSMQATSLYVATPVAGPCTLVLGHAQGWPIKVAIFMHQASGLRPNAIAGPQAMHQHWSYGMGQQHVIGQAMHFTVLGPCCMAQALGHMYALVGPQATQQHYMGRRPCVMLCDVWPQAITSINYHGLGPKACVGHNVIGRRLQAYLPQAVAVHSRRPYKSGKYTFICVFQPFACRCSKL